MSGRIRVRIVRVMAVSIGTNVRDSVEVKTMRKVKTISISLPPDVLTLVDQAAKETGLTRSSFITLALSMNEQVKEARKNGTV